MNAVALREADEFVKLVMAGVESWVKAGEIVARNLDVDPGWLDAVCKRCPEITEETVLAFDRVGRRKLHPRLLMSNKPGAVRLRAMPMELQEKYLASPVPLLVKSGKAVETLEVSVWNLTPDQCRQVFDKDGIRSEGAQRAWLESREARKLPPIQVNEPYRIAGSTLVVLEPCKLSCKQLLSLAAQMQ
jgi:hypothetical protein